MGKHVNKRKPIWSEDEQLPEKPDKYYLKGIFKAKPDHFEQPWPTIRTQTFVDMVFGSIEKRGTATFDDIVEDTNLDEDVIGVALADLLLLNPSDPEKGKCLVPRGKPRRITYKRVDEERLYQVGQEVRQ